MSERPLSLRTAPLSLSKLSSAGRSEMMASARSERRQGPNGVTGRSTLLSYEALLPGGGRSEPTAPSVLGTARTNPLASHRSGKTVSGPFLSGDASALSTVHISLSRGGGRPQSQGSKRVSGEDAEVSSILEEARALTASTERSLQRARTAELVLRSSRSASRPTSHIPTPELSAHASEIPSAKTLSRTSRPGTPKKEPTKPGMEATWVHKEVTQPRSNFRNSTDVTSVRMHRTGVLGQGRYHAEQTEVGPLGATSPARPGDLTNGSNSSHLINGSNSYKSVGMVDHCDRFSSALAREEAARVMSLAGKKPAPLPMHVQRRIQATHEHELIHNARYEAPALPLFALSLDSSKHRVQGRFSSHQFHLQNC